ncbi:hypothetical protein HYC85_018181 [Camellia sinensis]|uniref:Uncharacterized protein n=1 Tax=Camellia sinensis TaxID=4442 RepID=A0A7J7GX93_CAMSI|nr:hypothetical protein HYC85_018181 [Camellia sinensis]
MVLVEVVLLVPGAVLHALPLSWPHPPGPLNSLILPGPPDVSSRLYTPDSDV